MEEDLRAAQGSSLLQLERPWLREVLPMALSVGAAGCQGGDPGLASDANSSTDGACVDAGCRPRLHG
jgi:hypothetical protein